ncbi:MAG: hypothetical protein C3F10_05680 [Dehalococcoidia bacterium]|nr:MAG: hypothetical protein C3F10_05680 [Dehalococcoidia bacterium]
MLWQPPRVSGLVAQRCYVHEIGQGLLQILRQLCLWDWKPENFTLPRVTGAVETAFRSERFDYYTNYFPRLAQAEAEAGVVTHHVRRSAWNYQDNIADYSLEEADYAVIAQVTSGRFAQQIRAPLPLETSISPFNRRTAIITNGLVHADLMANQTTVSPDTAAGHQHLRAKLDDVLAGLTSRERRVIQLRFGLEDGRSRTLEEVGREFGVTRERIRQIEAKALKKLRHPVRANELKDFLDDSDANIRWSVGRRSIVAPGWVECSSGARWATPRDEAGTPAPMPKVSYWQLRRPCAGSLTRSGSLSRRPAPPELVPQGTPSRAHGLLPEEDFILPAIESAHEPAAPVLLDEDGFLIDDVPTPLPAPPPRPHQSPLDLPGALPLFEPPAPREPERELPVAQPAPPPVEPEQLPLLQEPPDQPVSEREQTLQLAVDAFRRDGYEVNDLRPRGGCLWVYDPPMKLAHKVQGLRTMGVRFIYAEHKTAGKWGWWIK